VAVQNLNLQSNSLNGTVPVALGSISGLRHLNLAINCFSGSLPPAVALSVTAMELFTNAFTGRFLVLVVVDA